MQGGGKKEVTRKGDKSNARREDITSNRSPLSLPADPALKEIENNQNV